MLTGVPGAGLQRARKSGRGRPMAFLRMSVRKAVRIMEVMRPWKETRVLWDPGCDTVAQVARARSGMTAA